MLRHFDRVHAERLDNRTWKCRRKRVIEFCEERIAWWHRSVIDRLVHFPTRNRSRNRRDRWYRFHRPFCNRIGDLGERYAMILPEWSLKSRGKARNRCRFRFRNRASGEYLFRKMTFNVMELLLSADARYTVAVLFYASTRIRTVLGNWRFGKALACSPGTRDSHRFHRRRRITGQCSPPRRFASLSFHVGRLSKGLEATVRWTMMIRDTRDREIFGRKVRYVKGSLSIIRGLIKNLSHRELLPAKRH